ncbi:MAG TPA: Asp-tRNA(Asn)/Glu-tRNA(Gln) amidotransferase subunit GatB [Armatimonadota bacterium]|jgi:aspartyl-tRNA(Asn)/glutamyl-tRNA(Gln) amidotransferase subunit B
MSDTITYEITIGMETHAELRTKSKMFCGCSAEFGGEPNSHVCPVCMGLPGSLPAPNARAIAFVVRTAMALHCQINSPTIFHRKNYFYPDLPKAYQISQYGDSPIGTHGYIDVTVKGETRRIGIHRVHLEEDTGKLFHNPGDVSSLVDYNRCGVPLMEIVSEPDIHSPEEAQEYAKTLRNILVYLGVSDGKMEEGSFRCEPNISIHQPGTPLGTRTELKNLNSFRVLLKSAEAEIKRQEQVIRAGGAIQQATLRWDEANGVTTPMRFKENEADYRYFPDPDLVPLEFSAEYLAEQRDALPELPTEKSARFVRDYGLSAYDADVLTSERPMAEYFEAAAKAAGDPKAAANWVTGQLLANLNAEGHDITETKVRAEDLGAMIRLIGDGTISGKIAKTVFDEMFQTGKPPRQIVDEKGLVQVSDEGAIEAIVEQVLAAHPDEAARFRGGEEKLMGFFVGQVMKASKGKANPGLANSVLKKKLS